MGFTTSYWQKERWSHRAADTLTSYERCWNPSLQVSEPAEAAGVERKLLEVISHPLHELSTSSRGAVVSSLCFSWVTLFTPAFLNLGLLSRTVCSPRIQNKGFRIPGCRRKQRKTIKPSEAGLREGTPTDIPIVEHRAPRSPFPCVSNRLVCKRCAFLGSTLSLPTMSFAPPVTNMKK